MKVLVGAQPSFGQDFAHHLAHDLLDARQRHVASVLRGDDDRMATQRQTCLLVVDQRELRFRVRSQLRVIAAEATFAQAAQDVVAVVECCRHQLFRLVASVAEHQALVAGAFFADAVCDVGGLFVDTIIDAKLLPVKALLFVAQRLHDFLRARAHLFGRDGGVRAHFACQHDAVGRCHTFDGDARGAVLFQVQIEDGIGDTIANFVGVSFGDGLARKKVLAHSVKNLLRVSRLDFLFAARERRRRGCVLMRQPFCFATLLAALSIQGTRF